MNQSDQPSDMSNSNVSDTEVEMTDSVVDRELGIETRSTTGLTDELNGAQVEVKTI